MMTKTPEQGRRGFCLMSAGSRHTTTTLGAGSSFCVKPFGRLGGSYSGPRGGETIISGPGERLRGALSGQGLLGFALIWLLVAGVSLRVYAQFLGGGTRWATPQPR
jgi:hypothetical protein